MSISGNIRTFRKKAGITQIDLANRLGISIATLRRWEAGETAPTGTRINELARILKIAPENIIVGDPDLIHKSAPMMNSGTLVFDNGGTRIELPPTEKGYEIFKQLVENMIKKEKEREISK